MKLAALPLLCAACTDPIVEMQFQVPANADKYNTSCVTAVEVRAIGQNFLQNPDDYTRSCIDVSGVATYAALRDNIHGKFSVEIPDSGLAGIAVLGWAGPIACKQSDEDPYYTPDLAFFAKGDYIGQDLIEVQSVPNLNCTSNALSVRIVDMFGLIASGSSAGCSAAMTYPDKMGGAGVGTIIPKMFGTGSVYYGGLNWADGIGSVASFQGLTEVGPKSCLALDGGMVGGGSTSCVVAGNVCASSTEYELPAVSDAILQATPKLDPATKSKFPGVIYGSVWSSGTTKTPIAGATVQLADPAHGKVLYIDPPDAGSGNVKVRADQSGTGPTGLFMVYVDTLVSVKINAAGKTRTVTLGATDDSTAAAMIVMQ